LGDISREDLARVLVQCLNRTPLQGLTFSVEGTPQDGAQEDLSADLNRLKEALPAAADT
jgi:hypothetical protein